METLREQFDQQKQQIIQVLLKPTNKKKKKEVEANNDAEELRAKVMGLDHSTIYTELSSYLDSCRQVFRDDYDELRKMR